MLSFATTLSQYIPSRQRLERDFNALPFKKIAIYCAITTLALIILTGNSKKAGNTLLARARMIAPHLVTKTVLIACLKALYEVYRPDRSN